jgi:multiple sugar transport system substrate-binding protein
MDASSSPKDGLSETALSRRTFLRSSLTASAGLTGILLTTTPPAFAQERELKLLTFAHFVPAADDELRRQLEEFGKQAGVKVRMDQVAHLQLPAVLASEVQGQKGHDIIGLSRFAMPNLYAKQLTKLDDLVEKIGRENGGWINKEIGKGGDGQYRGVPWFYISLPIAVRTDLLAEIGEELPDTWEDVRRIGQKLKAKGHPLGIAYSHCEDSNHTLRGIIWSFGGKEVEKDGKTVAINSKETVEAYKFMKALYNDTMDGDVLAWDDRNNNVCLNSGKCSMILNPISAYIAARNDKALIPGTEKPIHLVINHILPPKGPAGRHMSSNPTSIGIWEFSPLKDVAKEFLAYHFKKENYEKHIIASEGYNQAFFGGLTIHPIYASSPKYYFHPYIAWYSHSPGWPGSPTAAAEVVWDKFIIPDTIAACATGKQTAEQAVQDAEREMKRIYQRFVEG